MSLQLNSTKAGRWQRWCVRGTWLMLVLIVAAVYAMKLSRGQWPLSHPYSGLTLLSSAAVFGRFDWMDLPGRLRAQGDDIASRLLPVVCGIVLLGAFAFLAAGFR